MAPLTSPKVHYHPDMCPPIDNLKMEETGPWAVWRFYRETGNGYTGDWGTHHYDITQAALGMDGSAQIALPKGVYLVKIGKQTTKVLLYLLFPINNRWPAAGDPPWGEPFFKLLLILP